MMEHVQVVVLGGGPAGYTAALYCARAGFRTVILEKLSAGGQMATTAQIDNYPGFDEGVDGFELGMKMQAQAERFGAETYLEEVLSVDLTAVPKKIVTDSRELTADAVILATGASARKLGVPEEDSLVGRGVAYCATCDGMFYKGKTVAVIGGRQHRSGGRFVPLKDLRKGDPDSPARHAAGRPGLSQSAAKLR